jgi:DNA-binding NarL/FixJ family response regulator
MPEHTPDSRGEGRRMNAADVFTSAICASDDTVRQVIAVAVTNAGYDLVSETTQGAALVESARFIGPDVIVLDNDLPWRPGIEWLPELHEAHPTCAILLVANDPGIRNHAVEIGAFGVVYKNQLSELEGALARARAWLSDPELRKPGERRTGRDRRTKQDWNKVTSERRSGGDRRLPSDEADGTR